MNKQINFLVAILCIIKLTLHALADSHSGLHSDELLHIETGNHLALGYMEFPPFIGLLASLQNLFHSESIFIHHISVYVAIVFIFILTAKTVVEFGGEIRAVFLALLAILISPGHAGSQQLFQPVVFSQLFWILSFYQLLRYIKYLDKRYLWYLTFSVTLAFLTKYDAFFFISGLAALLFFKHTRQSLFVHQFWWNILFFLLIISPNIYWQYANNFPMFMMFGRLYETQLNELTTSGILVELFLSINPLNILFIAAAVIYMFQTDMKHYRPAGLAILLSIIFLILSKGKSYYFFPTILTIFPFGAVYLERVMISGKKWLFYPLSIVLLIGVILIPIALPLHSLKDYLNTYYPYVKEDVKGSKYPLRFEQRYIHLQWQETMSALTEVYQSLNPVEREDVLIWGKHYGQAGAVNLFGDRYELPNAFSTHGSFYSWLPHGIIPQTVIALRYSEADGGRHFEPYFEEVVFVKSIYNPYADEEERLWQSIFICRNPKLTFDELKTLFAHRIFE